MRRTWSNAQTSGNCVILSPGMRHCSLMNQFLKQKHCILGRMSVRFSTSAMAITLRNQAAKQRALLAECTQRANAHAAVGMESRVRLLGEQVKVQRAA